MDPSDRQDELGMERDESPSSVLVSPSQVVSSPVRVRRKDAGQGGHHLVLGKRAQYHLFSVPKEGSDKRRFIVGSYLAQPSDPMFYLLDGIRPGGEGGCYTYFLAHLR